jgi:hypothetical protein
MPLRTGHALVIPKIHVSRLSELPADYAAATGELVSKIANALGWSILVPGSTLHFGSIECFQHNNCSESPGQHSLKCGL